MNIATTIVQFDVKGGDNHHFAGADYIGKMGVHLGSYVLEFEILDRRPGLFQINKHLFHDRFDHLHFSTGKIPPFYLGVELSTATKEIIYNGIHQGRVQNKQRRTTQGFHLDKVQVGWHEQTMDVFAKFVHLYTLRRDRW